MPLVTPRIVNSVSCVKRIDHESHFAWQGQYLVQGSTGVVLFQYGVVFCST